MNDICNIKIRKVSKLNKSFNTEEDNIFIVDIPKEITDSSLIQGCLTQDGVVYLLLNTKEPEYVIDNIVNEKVEYLILNANTCCNIQNSIEKIIKYGIKVGIYIDSETNINSIDELLNYSDLIYINIKSKTKFEKVLNKALYIKTNVDDDFVIIAKKYENTEMKNLNGIIE